MVSISDQKVSEDGIEHRKRRNGKGRRSRCGASGRSGPGWPCSGLRASGRARARWTSSISAARCAFLPGSKNNDFVEILSREVNESCSLESIGELWTIHHTTRMFSFDTVTNEGIHSGYLLTHRGDWKSDCRDGFRKPRNSTELP